MNNVKWNREETILAFDLYCKIPFGKIQKTNNDIINLARILERTPSSVAMKMCNFASFDPELQARGVKGLQNASNLDKAIWEEFSRNLETLSDETSKTLHRFDQEEYMDENVEQFPAGLTKKQTIKVRVNQSLFRKAVLSAYYETCCVTGIALSKVLIASHIKPWRDSDPKTERTNPCNGLCLNSLHDRAFDKGLITIDTDYRIVLSKGLKDKCEIEVYKQYFANYEGKKIKLPHRFLPMKEMLAYHNQNVFEKI